MKDALHVIQQVNVLEIPVNQGMFSISSQKTVISVIHNVKHVLIQKIFAKNA